MALSVAADEPGALREALADNGWLGGEHVLAAGQLRQGKAPSMMTMITGTALVEVLRPRRSKKLPRHFVLAVTPTRVIAFEATGGSPEHASGPYRIRIQDGEAASYPREAVSMTVPEEGSRSKGGTMTVDGESFPVARPNLDGDPNTDELIAVLAGLPSAT